MVTKIISGGQTGADQGGLEAAEELGILTGGSMPKGCRTELGSSPEVASRFNLEILASSEYPPRTRYNILTSDGTVLFGSINGTGTKLTRKMCKDIGKPYVLIERFDEYYHKLFSLFLRKNNIKTLNVAGNRESKFPGLQNKVKNFLVESLRSEL